MTKSDDTADAAVPAEPAGEDAEAAASVVVPEQPRRHFWARLDHPFAVGFTLTLGALAALVLGLAISNLSTVIIYVVFALFAALGLDPLVRWLERHNVPRTWGIVVVFFGFAIVLVGALWLIVPTVVRQIASFFRDLPGIRHDFTNTDFFHWLEGIFGSGLETLVTDAQKFLTDPANIAAIGGGAFRIGVGIFSGISGGIIILVLTLYFLASLHSIKQGFYQLAPARNRPVLSRMTEQITDSVGSYLGGMVVLALINSIVALLLHLFLGLPFPALMAVVAFMITLIPLVGSVVFWVTASVLALFTSPVSALVFAVIYLVYMQIEAYVLTPRVMSRAISVPGSLVVIGALVGGTLLGLLGALVAIPVTASILLIIKQIVIPRQDAKVAPELTG